MAKSNAFPARLAVSLLLFAGCNAQFLTEAPVPQPKQAIIADLKDVMKAASIQSTEARIASLQEALRDTFAALPKNSRGAVRPPAARYALHRLFVQRHGWQFHGLEPRGETWDSSSPTIALGNRVPEDVVSLFESRLTDHGLDLHDLAVMAAMLENMVHTEADVRLSAALHAQKKTKRPLLNTTEASLVLETYMASFVLGADMKHLQPENMLQKLAEVPEQYPTWPATQTFLQDTRDDMAPGKQDLSFADLSEVVAAVGERYGRWQSHECAALKDELLQSEERPNTGRVRLSDFYGMALHGGKWQFSESVSYLRQLGALDESDPEVIRVIVPNYILGPSNCIASSGYYAVCCIDECDAHLTGLEQVLKSHEASSEAILAAVNRSIAPSLAKRLREIGDHHGGMVPLHGRLFAQWLHHLFPRDCPYPHMSGTTSPLRPEIFEEEMGQSVGASEDEMIQHVQSATWKKPPAHEDGMCSSMWTMEEELVDSVAHEKSQKAKRRQSASRTALHGVALMLAAVSLIIAVLKLLPSTGSDIPSKTVTNMEHGKVYSV
mmetsp:Transcript_10701/g.20107  ORF Transcript_10701/g.20107 Transcript_10701/m.20107 type:complete len:551 (-) Transcript_10701:46-1698(-)